MKTPAEWLAEQVADRPEDFAPDEMAAPLSWIASVQADARADRDELIQRMRGCLFAFVLLHQRGLEPASTIVEAEALIRESKPA